MPNQSLKDLDEANLHSKSRESSPFRYVIATMTKTKNYIFSGTKQATSMNIRKNAHSFSKHFIAMHFGEVQKLANILKL